MRRWYTLLVYCAAPFAFAAVVWRGLRHRGSRQGLGERFGFGPATRAETAIWLHAVSLGEVTAAASLIRALRSRYPAIPLLVTTATPTGRSRARDLFGDSVGVSFLPYDLPGSVRRFLRRVRPRIAIIMETELWPNLFNECSHAQVPVVLASARLSDKSVARYRRLGRLIRGIFTANVVIAAQSAVDAARFAAIGAPPQRIHVVGNLKFDLEVSAAAIAQGLSLRTALGSDRPTWIAGSTHAGEEEQVLDAHALLQAERPNALLLLVPRHPERFQAVAELLRRRGMSFARRSGGAAPGGAQVLLVDSVGELGMLYAAADAAFVGGSLVPIGGHNLLEPAALGLPVLTGPYNANGKDTAELLLREGAAAEVADARELAAALRRLFGDPAHGQRMGDSARRIVEANRGSLARLLGIIEPLLAEAGTAPAAQPLPAESAAAGR